MLSLSASLKRPTGKTVTKQFLEYVVFANYTKFHFFIQASKLSQQHVSDEIRGLLSAESFKVACSSVMKEMAVSCDLTDLEEVFGLILSMHVYL